MSKFLGNFSLPESYNSTDCVSYKVCFFVLERVSSLSGVDVLVSPWLSNWTRWLRQD